MTRQEALALRALIEKGAASLSDADALQGKQLFACWSAQESYGAGQRVRYEGVLYRCLQGHDAQVSWTPAAAPSLWAKVLVEDPQQIPPWEQPDSTNPYRTGDEVTHNGKIWQCTIDYNVWEPGVYGWTEVTA